MRSSDVVDTAREAAELDQPPLLVREPLEEFLDAEGIGAGRIEVEPIGEGHSNVTFLVERGDIRVVLRRPPRPPLPPSAHDVLREARLLSALDGTPVRVPKVLATVRRRVCAGRALLRDGGGSRKRHHDRHPGAARHPDGAPPDLRGARRSPRRGAQRSTGGPAGSRATASRPATSSASCAVSPASGSTTRRASCRWSRRSASGSPRTCPSLRGRPVVHGDYRLGNVMVAEEAPRT